MRYAILLLACVLIQVCLGGLYAWSSFVGPLRDSHGLSTAQTQVVFGGLIAVFTVAMVFAGRLMERGGPMPVAIIGGVLFGTGYVVASLSGGSFAVLLLGIAVVAGVGTGFGYVCSLATCMKCFPTHRGLVGGVVVAGFGGGAILMSALAGLFLARGIDVLMIFRWIGLSYGAAIVAAALVLRFPAAPQARRSRPAPMVGVLLRDRFFLALVLGMFCGTFAGLLVIGNLKPLALSRGISTSMAAAAISAFAVGNAVGRIVWGWMADRLGAWTIPFALILLVVAIGLLGAVADSPTGVVFASTLIGFGFGASFVVYAAQVASRYGLDRVGSVYPVVFLAYGAAGVAGPWVGGWLYDLTGSYTRALMASVAVLVAGLSGCGWLLPRSKADRS